MAKHRRKSGEGTIRHRKDGRWEGRIVVGYDDKGLPKTKSVLAKTKTDCISKLESLKEEIGTFSDNKCSSDMPFGEWMNFWYMTYCKNTLSENTQITYEERIYKQIITKIGNIPLNQITSGTLEKFYAHLISDGRLVKRERYGSGLSNSVIRSIHAHCRASLDKAVKENLIPKNPAEHCKLPPKKSPEIEILSPGEMQKLLFQAQIEGFYEMFLLDLATGLRRGELIGLQWNDIDFENGTLSVNKQIKYIKGELRILPPKTKASNRTIILPEPILKMLIEYRKTTSSIWLFPSPIKKEDLPRDPTACRKRLSSILEHAGCKHVPFHALRHTFASQAFHYGMDVKMLASTIGHESVETTLNIYAHSTDEMKRTAARKIDQAMGTEQDTHTSKESAMCGTEDETTEQHVDAKQMPSKPKFEPYVPNRRPAGTGYIKQLSANCWQGRYSPKINGKRISKNIYAHTEQECEEKLKVLVAEMKAELGIR